MRFDLSDEEWAVIEPLLPKGGRGPKRVDDRRVLNGIFYILRTGAPWRDLPERYGPRCPSFLSHPGHRRIPRRRRRRALHREGGKVFSGNGVWICLPAIGKALGASGCAGQSMAIPVASSSPHENPQTESSGVQAARPWYR